MTKEEIIRNLKYTMEKHKNDTVRTFDTNISVMCKDILDYLEQEPCDSCCGGVQTEKAKLCQKSYLAGMEHGTYEDAISRQAAIDAMCALCNTGETLKENPWRDNPHIDAIIDAIDNLQPVTPRPYEDCISRQAVLALAKEECDTAIIPYRRFVKAINALPPVTPQPKTGHWITKRTIMHDGEFYCDVCDNDAPFNKTFHFCPNCGAKMVESEEE